MTRKKKIVIIVVAVMLVIAVSATVLITVTKNKKSEEEAENTEIVMLDKEGLTNSASEEQEADTKPEGNNHTGTQTTTEKEEGDNQSGTQTTTEEAKKPTTESVSTDDGNKPTGGTSDTTSQPITTQTPTTQTQTTQAPTTQSPNATEQPSGGNQGNGNGGNTHQHTWEAQYRTVHHDEEGHYENVCVKKAYDEPVYEGHYFCNYCRKDITASGEGPAHCVECGPALSEDDIRYVPGVITTAGSSYSTGWVQVDTTHHEAVYEKKWIVDKKAYDEQVQDGYKCTTCGATK